eukprot:RCo051039
MPPRLKPPPTFKVLFALPAPLALTVVSLFQLHKIYRRGYYEEFIREVAKKDPVARYRLLRAEAKGQELKRRMEQLEKERELQAERAEAQRLRKERRSQWLSRAMGWVLPWRWGTAQSVPAQQQKSAPAVEKIWPKLKTIY